MLAGVGLVLSFIPYLRWVGLAVGIVAVIAAGGSLRHGVKGLGAAGIAAGLVVVFASLGQTGSGSTDPDSTPVGAPTGSTPTPASSTPGTGSSEPATPNGDRSDTPEASADTSGQQDGDDPGDEPDDGGRQTVEVTRVIDGDTFEARGLGDGPVPGRVVDVRMLEIDTVEEGQCGYEAATNKLAALLGDKITVERDEELKDQYGRYLLYAWNSDDTFVNLQMVETGYAEATLYEPNDKYWDRINAADTSDTYTPWPPCTTPEPQQDDTGGAYLYPPPPPDKDCGDVSASNFQVRPGDPHRFDSDGDGFGCEG